MERFLSFWFFGIIISIVLGFIPLKNTMQQFPQKASVITSDSLPHSFCGQDAAWNQLLLQNPTLQREHNIWENKLKEMTVSRSSQRSSSPPPPYELPIVIHVVHNNGTENIPLTQLQQGIKDLNDGFANVGYYDPSTGVDTRIQFCLALRDPDGGPTNGINRIVSPLTTLLKNSEDIQLKDLSRWNPTQYINIWLVKEICSASTSDCGVAGYAYFPSAHGKDYDGIVMEARWFGATQGTSGITVHEMGHYLGLYHTFQGGCKNDDCLSDGDQVCDTPPDKSIASIPCSSTINSCTTDVNTSDPNNPFTQDQDDQVINYMDYGDFNCYSSFTAGQRDRMHMSIENIRFSLLQSLACTSPCLGGIEASFTVSADSITIGQTVTFNNTSTNTTNSTWTINGIPFNGMSYLFDSIGIFTVTLSVANNDPNCVDEYSQTIQVYCDVNASFTSPSSTISLGETITFVNQSNNATNYTWSINGQIVGNAFSHTETFSNSGLFLVQLLASNDLCQDSFQLIFLIESPQPCQPTKATNFFEFPTNSYQIILGPKQFPDGNLLFFNYRGFSDPWINKTDLNGNTIWKKEVENIRNGNEDPCLLDDGTTILTNDDEYVYALDQDGDLKWALQLNQAPTGLVEFRAFNTGDGAIIFTSHNDGQTGKMYLWKYDSNGNLIWSNYFAFNNRFYLTWAVQHLKTARDNFWLVGALGSSWNPQGAALFQFDANGNLLTTELFQEDQSKYASRYYHDFSDQGVVISWSEKNQNDPSLDKIFLLKKNASGNTLWTKEVPTTYGLATGLQIRKDGGVVLFLSNRTMGVSSDGNFEYIQNFTDDHRIAEFVDIDQQPLAVIWNSDRTAIILSPVDSLWLIRQDCFSPTFSALNLIDRTIPPTVLNKTSFLNPFSWNNVDVGVFEGTDLVKTEFCPPVFCPEICANNIDDDGDGLIDCEDPDCCDELVCSTVPTPCDSCFFNNDLNLGPDIVLCDNNVIQLDANHGFNSYLWNTFSTEPSITTDQEGMFWVEATDSCGNKHRDSLLVTYLPETKLDLGPDQLLCQGDSITLTINSFDHFQWFTDDLISCDTCATITISPDTSKRYILLANTNDGCYSIDTININIDQPKYTQSNLVGCLNDTFLIGGNTIFQDTILQQVFPSMEGCDSTHTTSITFEIFINTFQIIELCQGDTALVFGNSFTQDTIVQGAFTTNAGCDSTHQVDISFDNLISTFQIIELCQGDTALVFGNSFTQDTIVQGAFTTNSGCDSIHQVDISFNNFINTFQTIELCQGDTATIFGLVFTQDTILQSTFSTTSGCDSTHQVDLIFNAITLQKDSLILCPGEFIIFYGDTIREEGIYEQSLTPLGGACDSIQQLQVRIQEPNAISIEQWPSCDSENDGGFSVSSTNDKSEYSLDGINFTENNYFDQLSGKEYTLYIRDEENCITTLSVNIPIAVQPTIVLPEEMTILSGESFSIPIEILDTTHLQFYWSPSYGLSCTECAIPIVTLQNSQSYELKVVDSLGCENYWTITFKGIEEDLIFVPNIFSPNGDNINDQLVIFGSSKVESIALFQVFHRWGGLVYQRENFPVNEVQYSWDGTTRGKMNNPGVYVYQLKFRLTSGEQRVLNGDFMLFK